MSCNKRRVLHHAARALPGKPQAAAVLDNRVAGPPSAYVKVTCLRLVDADLLGGGNDSACT